LSASERGLRRFLDAYVEYYLTSRTHLSLNKDAPVPRAVASPSDGDIVAISYLGGLHHRYDAAPRSARRSLNDRPGSVRNNSGVSDDLRIDFGAIGSAGVASAEPHGQSHDVKRSAGTDGQKRR
jgi:hypothetical protein